jgi:hypothetical protein
MPACFALSTARLIFFLVAAEWCLPYMGFFLPLVLLDIFSRDALRWRLPYIEFFLPLWARLILRFTESGSLLLICHLLAILSK